MAYDPETLGELTTALAGNVDLYNKLLAHEQGNDQVKEQAEAKVTETVEKMKVAEQRNFEYTNQIANLLTMIPISNTSSSQSMEQKIEEIKNRPWTK